MEYTATSFAEPLQRVFDDVLRAEQDVDVTHYRRVALPGADESSYRRRVPDRIERRLYEPVLAAVRGVGPGRARGWPPAACTATSATASTSLCGLLILLVVTR